MRTAPSATAGTLLLRALAAGCLAACGSTVTSTSTAHLLTPTPGAPSTAPVATVTPEPTPPPSASPSASPASTPTPAVALPSSVPAGFAPLSVTFVSAAKGFVLGTVPCAASGGCLALARTTDAGHTWIAMTPPPSRPSQAYSDGVRRVRFADEEDGWVFAPELWATHDGGAHWVRQALPGAAASGQVQSVEVGDGRVRAAVLDTAGVQLLASPTTSDAWTAATTTIASGAGPVPQGQLVLQGAAGWAVEVDRTVVGGARLGAGGWASWQPPCSSAGGAAALGASSPTALAAVCVEGTWTGGPQGVHVYLSGDGGSTFQRGATALPLSDADAVAMTPSGTLVVAGSGSGTGRLLASTDHGATWTAVFQGDTGMAAGELGFTTPTQGVAVSTGAGGGRLLMTYDGGLHWSPVAVS